MKLSQHSWFHLSALKCTVFLFTFCFFTVDFLWYFLTQQNMALIGFLFSWKLMGTGENMNIYLRKQNTCKKKKKRKHVCFLLFVLGIFMLPLLLMCQCCGRDLHLATHATILWCCLRMYQHEIKKKLWLFFLIYSLKESGLVFVSYSLKAFSLERSWEVFDLFHVWPPSEQWNQCPPFGS